ncbi:MAG: hypothetical protein PVF96_05900 [Candidatus Bathyarchaeota archaeon]
MDSQDISVGIALLQTMFPLGSMIGSLLAGYLAQTMLIQAIFQLSAILFIPTILILIKIDNK